jgi:hypothetical protein
MAETDGAHHSPLKLLSLGGSQIQRPRSQLMAYFRWRRGTRSVHFGHPETPDEER